MMRREADVVAKLKAGLLKELPGAVILKLQDYMTQGIPDLVVNWGQRTPLYIEVKLLRPRETPTKFRQHFDPLQLATCCLLDNQVKVRYLITYDGGKRAVVAEPHLVKQFLEDGRTDIELFPRPKLSFGEAVDRLALEIR